MTIREDSAGTTAPVLVVEDETAVRETIRWLLEDEGFPVAAARDGGEALEIASQVQPALVLLDMGLPVKNGEEVAAGLRSLYHGVVPILVITADGNAASKAARVHAVGYLQKPFELDVLLATVQRTLEATG